MRRFHRLAPLWVALASFLLGVILALFTPLPEPQFHDEFSYVLAGDTFAHGRLTNRPHPMWEFLETFQVIQQPTYMSKYPPGQGIVLALGQVVTREPIVGGVDQHGAGVRRTVVGAGGVRAAAVGDGRRYHRGDAPADAQVELELLGRGGRGRGGGAVRWRIGSVSPTTLVQRSGDRHWRIRSLDHAAV